MARKHIGTRRLKKAIYIIGEGITEQYYFKHLKHIKGYSSCNIKPALFGNTSVLDYEKKIPDLLKDEADVICVFDADVSKRNEIENQRLQALKEKYATSDNVCICDSLQCIEYWFILHFEDTCPLHNNGNDTVKLLKKYIPNYDKTEKYLEKAIWVQQMSTNENMKNAHERAIRHQNGNSYTYVYKAVDRLDGALHYNAK